MTVGVRLNMSSLAYRTSKLLCGGILYDTMRPKGYLTLGRFSSWDLNVSITEIRHSRLCLIVSYDKASTVCLENYNVLLCQCSCVISRLHYLSLPSDSLISPVRESI